MAVIPRKRQLLSAMLAVVAVCLACGISTASPQAFNPNRLLKQAERASYTDASDFRHLLEQLHRNEDRLTPLQRQELALLDAMRANLSDHFAQAIGMYKSILRHTREQSIAVKAKVALAGLYLRNKNYVHAYAMSNAFMAKLPGIKSADLKRRMLGTIILVLANEERYDQALKYADRMYALARTAADKCKAEVYRTQMMVYRGENLTRIRNAYRKTIALCRSAGQSSFANALRVDWAGLLDTKGRPQETIALAKRITTMIDNSGVRLYITGLHAVLARAYLDEGKNELARKSALATLAASAPGSFNWNMRTAYDVLYKVREKAGEEAAALASYRKYVAQRDAADADAKAQALAYQMVRQQVLQKKFRLGQLSKQNRILQLQQALDRKVAETNRLYILLLLLVLVFIALWAYRIKHSQLRFRKMARHDDLTDIFNRQYFFEQARRTLQRLQKTRTEACALILDMDHFKQVNDRYGHFAGDAVLKRVVAACKHELRSSDVFGRLGGEEFGILMPDCTQAQGMEIGERIRHTLARTSIEVGENVSVTVTASIGLACTAISGYALKALLLDADNALYAAKHAGRNRIVPCMEQISPTVA